MWKDYTRTRIVFALYPDRRFYSAILNSYRDDADRDKGKTAMAKGCPRSATFAASPLYSLLFLHLFVAPLLLAFPIPCPDRSSTQLASTSTMRSIAGLREIVDDYDVLLLDMWGVLHDGERPYTGVLEAVQKLRSHDVKKKLIVLSNSSKPKEHSRRSLLKLGFDPDTSFDAIITSGEVCKDLLSSSPTAKSNAWWSNLQASSVGSHKKAVVLGSGEDDLAYCQSCGWSVATSVEEASLILARGTMTIECWGDDSTRVSCSADPTGYATQLESLLAVAAQRRLPMLVANPDKIRPDAARSPMPGAIGERYRELLGGDDDTSLIERIGKPFPQVYTRALEPYQDNTVRVLMVGDALETDVVGGAATGIDTLWVLSDGVFAGDARSPQDIVDDFNQHKDVTYARGLTVTPTMWMPHFRW